MESIDPAIFPSSQIIPSLMEDRVGPSSGWASKQQQVYGVYLNSSGEIMRSNNPCNTQRVSRWLRQHRMFLVQIKYRYIYRYTQSYIFRELKKKKCPCKPRSCMAVCISISRDRRFFNSVCIHTLALLFQPLNFTRFCQTI